MPHTRMTALAFLLLALSPFVLLEIDFSSPLNLEYPLEYFYGTWQKCRTGPDKLLYTRMTTLPFLLLASFPFVSSPEHEVLMVSYCGQSMSVVRRPSCGVNNCFKSLLLLHPWAN